MKDRSKWFLNISGVYDQSFYVFFCFPFFCFPFYIGYGDSR